MSGRTLHLNVNLLHSGVYPSAWRLPDSRPDAFIDIDHFVRVARIAERGKLDAIFLADTPAINDRIDYRPFNALEPTVVLASVAAATSHVGLVATASTTYNEPYNLARRFASLDLVSRGRAGWNVVTTADAAAGRNFGFAGRPSTGRGTPGPGNSPSWSTPCGTAGRTTRSSATRRAAGSSTPGRSTPFATAARTIRSRARSRCRAARKGAR